MAVHRRRVLFKATVAASETYNTAVEQHLRDTLGVWFAERPGIDPAKRPIREIVGVDPRLNQRWSTRRAHIVFLINAAAFLAVIAVIAWWRGNPPARVLPREHVGEAHWTPAG